MVGTVSGWDGKDGRVSCYGAAQSPTSTMSILPIPVQPKPPARVANLVPTVQKFVGVPHRGKREPTKSQSVAIPQLLEVSRAGRLSFLQQVLCAHAAAHRNRKAQRLPRLKRSNFMKASTGQFALQVSAGQVDHGLQVLQRGRLMRKISE